MGLIAAVCVGAGYRVSGRLFLAGASSSHVTTGVFVGTSCLVAVAFLRQLLAIKDNLRLYGQLNEAYHESLAHSIGMEILNEGLENHQRSAQSNNEALARANLSLQTQATTDPLTGLPNHRSMVLALDQELERSMRYARPCALLFLDLDHFKAMNDSCGHLAGDSVLSEMVTPILAGLRTADVAGRWGGEEFLVILPETELADAVVAAERIRDLVSGHRFSIAGGAHLTCSIGVAAYPYDASTRDELVEAADQAMYAAKRLGRDQVRAAMDPSVVAFLSQIRRASSREETTISGIVQALTTVVRVHDPAKDARAQEVSNLAMRVASSLGLSPTEVRIVGLAARLHDIGMVSVPQSILQKQSALNSDDWSTVIAHPAIGAEVVASVPSLNVIAPIIRAHHERWDGTGYPDGLHGDRIPMGARVISACVAFCAITHGSSRSVPRTTDEALAEMNACAGTQFDPKVVRSLEQVVLSQRSEPVERAS